MYADTYQHHCVSNLVLIMMTWVTSKCIHDKEVFHVIPTWSQQPLKFPILYEFQPGTPSGACHEHCKQRESAIYIAFILHEKCCPYQGTSKCFYTNEYMLIIFSALRCVGVILSLFLYTYPIPTVPELSVCMPGTTWCISWTLQAKEVSNPWVI